MVKKVHFIGIGGVGMAALAILLKKRGDEVSGCDLKPTKRTDYLSRQGISLKFGHSPKHLSAGVDEVIVTPAVKADEPELVAARQLGLKIRRRGEVLAELVNSSADSIVVCGSHGKTTTATYITKLLAALGEKVAWAIGGETGDFPVAGANASESKVLVVEGDESDGTLALYHAQTLVVTNVEYDHPDHFPTMADYEACFATARAQAREVIEGRLFSVEELGRRDPNAELAIKVALKRGYSQAGIEAVLPKITAALPDRRFEEIIPRVYADYAHHPTEITYTLKRARQLTKGKLRVLFQPHRYSRTQALKREFAAALALADEVIVCPTYAAFERPVEGGDSADLYAAMRNHEGDFGKGGAWVFLSRSCEEAWEHVSNSRSADDLVILLGAGDIIDLKPLLQAGTEFAKRKVLIGGGSNTWKSDLKLNIEYVKSNTPAGRSGAEFLRDPLVARLIPYMAGIPGTLGGWVKMNAGAFGHSISEAIAEVKVDGKWLAASACDFGYRHSGIQGEIQGVKWRAAEELDLSGLESQESYLARRKRFPSGTFGSFFKNPSGDSAGRLLEAAGAKAMRVGGAYVWSKHANVIVRGEGSRASDVLALSILMERAVYFRFGIHLEREVVFAL